MAIDIYGPPPTSPGSTGPAGPMGPAGPAGPAGDGAASNYIHVQGTAALSWTINHNLGFYPNITTVDSTNREVEGGILHMTASVAIVTFEFEFSGKAFAS